MNPPEIPPVDVEIIVPGTDEPLQVIELVRFLGAFRTAYQIAVLFPPKDDWSDFFARCREPGRLGFPYSYLTGMYRFDEAELLLTYIEKSSPLKFGFRGILLAILAVVFITGGHFKYKDIDCQINGLLPNADNILKFYEFFEPHTKQVPDRLSPEQRAAWQLLVERYK